MANADTAKRCKVCELGARERAAVDAALPAALAADDDGDALRGLASTHAVTMTALRRHAAHGSRAVETPAAVAPAAPAPAPVAPLAKTAPKSDPGVAEAVAGDGWDGAVEDVPDAPSGAHPWLRRRPAREELDAQVKRLGDEVRRKDLPIADRLKLEPLLRQALAQLSVVTGESKPSDMDRLLVSPEFARVMGAIGDVLKRRCPEAFPEVIAAVKALDTTTADRAALAA